MHEPIAPLLVCRAAEEKQKSSCLYLPAFIFFFASPFSYLKLCNRPDYKHVHGFPELPFSLPHGVRHAWTQYRGGGFTTVTYLLGPWTGL